MSNEIVKIEIDGAQIQAIKCEPIRKVIARKVDEDVNPQTKVEDTVYLKFLDDGSSKELYDINKEPSSFPIIIVRDNSVKPLC